MALGLYLGLICIIIVPYFLKHSAFKLSWLISIAILLIIIGLLIWYVFISDTKNRIKYGIKITESYVSLFGKKILMRDIKDTEILHVYGCGRYLAILFKDKDKIKLRLIRDNETSDIETIYDIIHHKVGIYKEKKVKNIGPYMSFYRWRKDLMKKVNKEETSNLIAGGSPREN